MGVSRESAGELSIKLGRVMKQLHALRQQTPRFHPQVDTMSHPILFNLLEEPKRVSTLAECIHSDTSTVSRQVSQLAASGLVEKVSDPLDGRAQMVSLTTEGHDLIAQLADRRADFFARLLHDWSDKDVVACTAYLERLADAIDTERRAQTHAAPTPTGSTE